MDREQLKLEIIYQYYMYDLGQAEIARKYSISRSYVSKLLIEAKKEGLVEIKINKPLISENERERALRERYDLKHVMIAGGEGGAEDLGDALNAYLNNILNDGDVIGVAWGKTLWDSSKKLQAYKPYKNLMAVQLCGGVSFVKSSTYASEIVTNYAEAFGAEPCLLPLPAIVENHEFKKSFLKEDSINRVMNLIQNVNIAVFTVGKLDTQSALVRSDYISKAEIESLISQGAIGDICTHVINREGKICNQSLEDRSTSISLDNLKNCSYKIAIVSGVERILSLKAALCAGYINVLIINKEIADGLIREHD
ncbi:MAG: sugar-binding transcriptional regulator [Oscillospiraceae bacterium]|nr:sugar-binding transcriptional regulator [Oscillospiraceae bacterium]